MLGESINIGRGLPSQGLQYAGQALQAGQATAQNAAAWQNAGQAIGTPNQFAATSGNALGNWANALGSGYNAQIGASNATSQRNAGIGTAIGTGVGAFFGPIGAAAGGAIGGAAGTTLSSESGGEIRAAVPLRADGGPGAVPMVAHDGEYIVPPEVMARKGSEFFDKLVAKTREELAEREQGAQVAGGAMAIPPPSSVA